MPTPAEAPFANILDRNIRVLMERRVREEKARPLQHRIAAKISAFGGSMAFVYLHLALFGFWIIANLPQVPFPKFDPTFVVLAMFASVEAIFISTFVLITQNRMAELADKRNELNLQISLLAEHEVTKLVQLVSEIAVKMGVEQANDPHLDELKRDVAPEGVLDTLDHAAQRAEAEK